MDTSSVSNIFDAIVGGKIFAKFPLYALDQHNIAFSTELGLFSFHRRPLGLNTAPLTFQHILNTF